MIGVENYKHKLRVEMRHGEHTLEIISRTECGRKRYRTISEEYRVKTAYLLKKKLSVTKRRRII